MSVKLLEMFDSPVASRAIHEGSNGMRWEGSLVEAKPTSGGHLSQGKPGCFGRLLCRLNNLLNILKTVWEME